MRDARVRTMVTDGQPFGMAYNTASDGQHVEIRTGGGTSVTMVADGDIKVGSYVEVVPEEPDTPPTCGDRAGWSGGATSECGSAPHPGTAVHCGPTDDGRIMTWTDGYPGRQGLFSQHPFPSTYTMTMRHDYSESISGFLAATGDRRGKAALLYYSEG